MRNGLGAERRTLNVQFLIIECLVVGLALGFREQTEVSSPDWERLALLLGDGAGAVSLEEVVEGAELGLEVL